VVCLGCFLCGRIETAHPDVTSHIFRILNKNLYFLGVLLLTRHDLYRETWTLGTQPKAFPMGSDLNARNPTLSTLCKWGCRVNRHSHFFSSHKLVDLSKTGTFCSIFFFCSSTVSHDEPVKSVAICTQTGYSTPRGAQRPVSWPLTTYFTNFKPEWLRLVTGEG